MRTPPCFFSRNRDTLFQNLLMNFTSHIETTQHSYPTLFYDSFQREFIRILIYEEKGNHSAANLLRFEH